MLWHGWSLLQTKCSILTMSGAVKACVLNVEFEWKAINKNPKSSMWICGHDDIVSVPRRFFPSAHLICDKDMSVLLRTNHSVSARFKRPSAIEVKNKKAFTQKGPEFITASFIIIVFTVALPPRVFTGGGFLSSADYTSFRRQRWPPCPSDHHWIEQPTCESSKRWRDEGLLFRNRTCATGARGR